MLRKFVLLISMLTVTACQGRGTQSSPEAVIQRIFDSAKTKQLGQLSSLCAPHAETTAHIICEISKAQPQKKEEFIHHFWAAKIRGNTAIVGYTATVQAVAQPGLEDTMQFELIQENGNWYLQRFQE